MYKELIKQTGGLEPGDDGEKIMMSVWSRCTAQHKKGFILITRTDGNLLRKTPKIERIYTL